MPTSKAEKNTREADRWRDRLKSKLASRRVSWPVYLLFFPFGLGAWITINGTFAELPVFAATLPEGWSIASKMSIAVQVANLFPLLYLFLVSRRIISKSEILPTHVTLVSCVVVTFLTGIAWKWGVNADGSGHSWGLLLFTFLGGASDATTSLLFWPFASRFHAPYTTALAAGESSSAIVCSLLALAQNVSDHKHLRYPVGTFFFLLAVLVAISWVSFWILSHWKVCTREMRVEGDVSLLSSPMQRSSESKSKSRMSYGSNAMSMDHASTNTDADANVEESDVEVDFVESARFENNNDRIDEIVDEDCVSSEENELSTVRDYDEPSTWQFAHQLRRELICVALTSFVGNGIMPAISTYICLPYIDGAKVLMWSGLAASIAAPFASMSAKWWWAKASIIAQTALWGPIVIYLIIAATMSPHPPLYDAVGAGAIPAIFSVVLKFSVAFTKTCAFVTLTSRFADNPERRSRASKFGGAAVQTGSLAGSFVMFFLVQYGGIFKQ